jgi:hypothetical protein
VIMLGSTESFRVLERQEGDPVVLVVERMPA